jgi:hypothetical protein
MVEGPAAEAAAGGGRRRPGSFLLAAGSNMAIHEAPDLAGVCHAHHMFVEMLPCRDSCRKNLGIRTKNELHIMEKGNTPLL